MAGCVGHGKGGKISFFDEINKERMSEEELEPAITRQLDDMTLKYWQYLIKSPHVEGGSIEKQTNPVPP